MAGVISEDYLSRPFTVGRQSGRELIYNILGTQDEIEVFDLVFANAPPVYGGLGLETITAEPLGGGVWKGHARYLTEDDFDEYTFDTSGGTQHITQSLDTASYAPLGQTAPDFEGAIGVSEDSVAGVEITVPQFEWTETHRFADGAVTGAYKRILFQMTGRWNDDDFKGFSAGECKFMGATGTRRGLDSRWVITFRFSGSENIAGATIGDITGIDKLGWDYLWVRYADYEDAAAVALVKRPVAVYVERVALPGDFSLLNIGT